MKQNTISIQKKQACFTTQQKQASKHNQETYAAFLALQAARSASIAAVSLAHLASHSALLVGTLGFEEIVSLVDDEKVRFTPTRFTNARLSVSEAALVHGNGNVVQYLAACVGQEQD